VKSVLGSKKATKKDAVEFVRARWRASDYRCTQMKPHLDDHNVCESLIMMMAYAYTNGMENLFPIADIKKKYKFVRING